MSQLIRAILEGLGHGAGLTLALMATGLGRDAVVVLALTWCAAGIALQLSRVALRWAAGAPPRALVSSV